MSEYEGLRSEIMTVMDSLNEYGRTVTRYMGVANDQVAALWADNAELRDELHAVANRVETLTRAVMADPAEVAQAIVNDANRSTLREVHDAGSPLYREERGRYLIECSCGWEYEGKTEQDAKIAYGQHADRFVA